MAVVLINPFEVPAAEEERFLALWRETAEQGPNSRAFSARGCTAR